MSKTEREHARYAHEAAVTFHVGDHVQQGHTQNVSRGGLCAHLAEPMVVGQELEVDLVLVFDDDMQSEALHLPGRVVWCTTVDDVNQVGVAFRPLDAEHSRYLEMFLRYLGDRRAEKQPRAANVDDRFR